MWIGYCHLCLEGHLKLRAYSLSAVSCFLASIQNLFFIVKCRDIVLCYKAWEPSVAFSNSRRLPAVGLELRVRIGQTTKQTDITTLYLQINKKLTLRIIWPDIACNPEVLVFPWSREHYFSIYKTRLGTQTHKQRLLLYLYT